MKTKSVIYSTLNHFLNEDKEDLMDLTYPTFTESYTTVDDIENVKILSNQFVNYIINENSIYDLKDLLDLTDYDDFEQQYNTYLNAWIVDRGYDYEIPVNEYPIFFDRNPRSYYAIWYTDHITWNLSNGYKSQGPDKVLFGNPLLSDYKTLKNEIMNFEKEMDKADNLLKDESIEYRDLTINIGSTSSGINYYTSGNIYLTNLFTLNHEYIQYITNPYLDSFPWIRESVAYYYDYAHDFFYKETYYQYLYDYILSGEPYPPEGYLDKLNDTVYFFREKYGVEPNFSEDKMELNDIYVYLEGRYNDVYQVYDMGISDYQYVSFVHFFIETHSEDTFRIVIVDDSRLVELTGKTWPEHINDWEQYIKAKYE
jgi:hypothetical protein